MAESCPLLSADLVALLHEAHVDSVEELLLDSAAVVAARSSAGLREAQVNEAVALVAQCCAGIDTNAFQVVTGMGPQHRATGQTDFDNFFAGGLPVGQILELVGPGGVGKTQLCMWLAVRIALRDPNSRVIFISSDNSLDAVRMKSFLPLDTALEDCLGRIQVQYCFDAEALLQYLYETRDAVLANEMGFGRRTEATPSLLIIDSVAPLISPLLTKNPFGHSIIFALRQVLLEIAAASKATVVLTNFTKGKDWGRGGGRSDEFNPVETVTASLGHSWSLVAQMRLWMSSTNEGETSVLTLIGTTQQRACMMHMTTQGLIFRPIESKSKSNKA